MSAEKVEKPVLIFLSYAVKDKERAVELEHLLTSQPRVRVKTMNTLSAGEDWVAGLQDALHKCDLFIVLLTPDALESSWVTLELGAAYGLGKPIIAVYTRRELVERVPIDLRSVRAVDFRELKKPKTLSAILESDEKQAA